MRAAITRFRKEVALYPAGVACLPILYLFVISGSSPFAAGRAFVVAILLGSAFAILGRLLAGDRDIGGLVGLLLLFSLITFTQPIASLALLGFTVVLVVVARLPAERRPAIRWGMLGTTARRIAAIAALAVVILAVQVGTPGTLLRAAQRETPWTSRPAAEPSSLDAPDIYLLMLDGHPRQDVLRDTFAADDGPFLDALRQRGFDVATQSHSNYPVTALSLASLFNMRHLADIPSIAADTAAGLPQAAVIRRAINESEGLATARQFGYEVVSVSGGFEQVSLRESERFIDTGPINEFEIQAMFLTGLGQVIERVAPDTSADLWRKRIAWTFDRIGDIAGEPHTQPRLVFGHIPSPHPPWVDHDDGSLQPIPASPAEIGPTFFQGSRVLAGVADADATAAFVEQVAYVDDRAIETIDRILRSASRPTVVVVFSDHGAGPANMIEDHGQRLRNLMAARTPGVPTLFDDDQTIVNLLPSLWNAYLGTDLPMSPETMFGVPDEKDLLELVPVTDAP